jgi:hypothetical protein
MQGRVRPHLHSGAVPAVRSRKEGDQLHRYDSVSIVGAGRIPKDPVEGPVAGPGLAKCTELLLS